MRPAACAATAPCVCRNGRRARDAVRSRIVAPATRPSARPPRGMLSQIGTSLLAAVSPSCAFLLGSAVSCTSSAPAIVMPTDYLKKILTAKVYDVAIETTLDAAPTLSHRLENRVLLKREDQQPVFSFKPVS